MASWRYALLAAITICLLDVLSIVAAAATIMWNPKMSRYVGSYNLDKGPVFYEAYYPDTRDAYREKRYFGRNTVLETSFQMPPSERFAYSPEIADHPISTINESSFIVVDNDEETLPREQREAIASRRNYDTVTSRQFAPFPNKRSTTFNNDKNSQVASVEEISKLVRRAISRDLENWNALEGYLDHTVQDRSMHSGEIYKDKEAGDSYTFPVNHKSKDSTERLSIFEASLPRKLDAHDGKQRPMYLEGVDADGNAMPNEMRISGTQAVDTPPPINVISGSLPLENIFQPRPQLIKYMFFKRPVVPPWLDKQNEKAIEESTPHISGDNFTREEIADNNRSNRTKENDVKVTSIEVSELPRHKTRHHHGEWLKRDYSSLRHRS